MKKKALIGLSGGVDSSVAALLLVKRGYDVTGVTMKLSPLNASADRDIADAKKVADKLGIKHIVLDFSETFQKEIINYFTSEYQIGRTPNPCVMCNKKIKFGLLFDYALKNGFDFVTTGHYAQVTYDETLKKHLLKKNPTHKDQSYFLYSLTQKQLSHVIFPIGSFEKKTVREVAKENELPVAEKSESQDICFIKGQTHTEFMQKLGIVSPEGYFLNDIGEIVGKHRGIINYTVGQRKKLGVALGKPMHVQKINYESNTVVLHENEPEKADGLVATDVNFTLSENIKAPFRAEAKIRYRAQPVQCLVTPTDNKEIKVVFDEPQKSIAPGQSVVLYDGDVVLGGGVIVKSLSVNKNV